mmetsp:Transcript_37466/g.111810  ORF Transcript_37466/g.111810 Transcript_37466/m.111810 type:complete len:127 (+) Transcript_37466:796-1176(+)
MVLAAAADWRRDIELSAKICDASSLEEETHGQRADMPLQQLRCVKVIGSGHHAEYERAMAERAQFASWRAEVAEWSKLLRVNQLLKRRCQALDHATAERNRESPVPRVAIFEPVNERATQRRAVAR